MRRATAVVLAAGCGLGLASNASANTTTRAILTEAQLYQLFDEAEIWPGTVFVGVLAPRTFALTKTLRLRKGQVVLKGGSDVSSAASYVLDCSSGCRANGGSGRVVLVERDASYTGDLRLELNGVTLTKGYSTEFGLRGGGGALVRNGSLSVQNSIVRNNKANQWGAGLLVAGSGGFLSISQSMIRENENDQLAICGGGQTAVGGGVAAIGAGRLIISRTSITGNKACRGGGVVVNGDATTPVNFTMTNSTVSNNHAIYKGGGVLAWGALQRFEIAFSTIAYNRAGIMGIDAEPNYGGGIAFYNMSTVSGGAISPPIQMIGTVLAKNTLDVATFNQGADCYSDKPFTAATTGVASNFIGKNGNCGDFLNWTTSTGGTTLVGTETSPLEPMLTASLTATPNPPLAHMPLPSSPLPNAFVSGQRIRNLTRMPCLFTDITNRNRGAGSSVPTTCDIGAYELTAGR